MLVVVTLEDLGQLLKSYKVGVTGLLCFVMLTVSVLHVSIVNVQVLCLVVI